MLQLIFDIMKRLHWFIYLKIVDLCDSYQQMSNLIWIFLFFTLYILIIIWAKMVYNLITRRNRIPEIVCRAIENDDVVESIRLLQIYPDSTNWFSENGYTPFQIACAKGNTQLVKIMLQKGADVKLKSCNGESPFYLTTFHYIKHRKCKNATCIRELYYAGADVNETNAKGLTPLQMAAMFGHTPLAKWLLSKGASCRTIPSPYFIAYAQGHVETAKVIWNLGNNFSISWT